MKVLIISHAYATSYNRRDKLARLAKLPDVDLGVVVPKNWRDRMLKVSRKYKSIPEDSLYKIWSLPTFLTEHDLWYSYPTLSLHKIVKKFDPDIIHVEQEAFSQSLFQICAMNKFFWRKKLIAFFWENIDRKLNPIQKLFRYFNLKNIDFAICGNSDAEKLIRKYEYKKLSKILPQFGVDEQKFYPKDVSGLRTGLKLGKFIIGFVGRLVPEKGVETLLQAVKKVKGNFSLLILTSTVVSKKSKKGKSKKDQPCSPYDWTSPYNLQKLLQGPSLQKNLKIIDALPHEKFPDYMNLFDVLVLPSQTTKTWKEQFGRVMIEAMACGVPVIGSSSGAIPEVIGDAGLIFEEKNTQDLTEKIELLMQNTALREGLSKKSLERVRRHFTHDKIIRKIYQIYTAVLP